MLRFSARSALAVLCMLLCLALLAACAPTATTRVPATATTLPATSATPTGAAASDPCQPDAGGVYAAQTGFVATLPHTPLPAPPQTKQGVASLTQLAHATLQGDTGMCTIGTFASVTAFYTQQLPALGWKYATPPAALYACFPDAGPPIFWWKGANEFAWYEGADAGAGSVFWSYTYCTVQS